MSHFECEHGHRVDNYLFFEREGKGQAVLPTVRKV